jgi:uncharacterized RDD family membrane protein YckC
MSVVGATYRLMATVATPTAQRTLDELFAGPAPEMVGRALREHAVLERIASAYADGAPLDERARELLQRPDVQRLLVDVLATPAVRRALAQQSTSFAEDALAALRRRARDVDVAVERAPRRWIRRRRAVTEDVGYAGLTTRALAFLVDGIVVSIALLLAAAAVGIVTALTGPLRPAWLAGALFGTALFVAQVVYFAGFWSTLGQTPGMRVMGIRLVSSSHSPLRFGRALLRFVAVVLSIIPCFAGFAPALFDDRRRALPDFVARTIVTTVEPT